MSDIFISYSSEDKSRVQDLARALELKGWSVWWDRRIPVGRSYAEVIEEALDASKAVVVVWTTTSVKSQWVKNEALEGLNRRALFPVMLELVKIPLEFRHVQAARLMDWQPEQDHAAFDQFIDDLAGAIGAPVLQSQAAPASSTKPRSEPEIEPRLGMVRVALSGNNNLSALTISPGSLSPAFNMSTLNYTVDVASTVTSITVTPRLQDTTANMMVHGQATNPGETRTIVLNGPGSSTPLTIVVTAPNGAYKTYTVEVDRAAEVESEPAQLEPELSAPMADATNSDLPQEPFSSQTATESSRSNQDFGQAGDNRSSESIGTAQSTGSIPYVPIGIGLIAAVGALVYFLLFSQGASRQYQSPVQAPSKKTEVVTPTPAPEPTQQVSTTHAQEKPSVKQEAGSTKSITSKKDGASMVLVPGGSFQMGSTRDEVDRAINDCVKELERDQQTCEGWYEPEVPQHKVQINPFHLDKYEVTNQLFQQFVLQAGHQTTAEQEGSAQVFVEGKGWEEVKGASWRKPEAGASVFDSNRADHPVVTVSWGDARAYCRWAGKRLPTEAEFEYALRAGTTTKYWWGATSPGSRRVANVADESAKHLLKVVMSGYNDGAVRTAAVGSYEANPWGLHDMSGNVAEWTSDWYSGDYYSQNPPRNPKGPSSGEFRVVRGGSWANGPVNVRSAYRNWYSPSLRLDLIGFRCAQDVR